MHVAANQGTPYLYLLIAASIVAIVARRIRAPYALALVIFGLVLGLPGLLPTVRLVPQVLFTVFLPPLLFESAINLRADALRREWKPITLYSLAVTILSTFIIGYLAAWILHLPIRTALVFGALISATDPISVIAVFKQLGANPRLTLLMDAEALFNDGVAVVLFTVLLEAATGRQATVADGLLRFAVNGVGGVGIGALIGYLAARATRHFDDHLLEITLTTIVAFGSYLAADALGVSGVLSVIAAGLVIGNYGMKTSMSATTRLAVSAFWEYAAFAVNSVVFLIVGIEEANAGLIHALPTVLLAAFVVLCGRVAVYPVSFVANRLHCEIPARFQHVLVWGGLRGALSMALALGLPPDFPHRETIVTATFGAVLFSLLAQGLTIGPLLSRLGLTRAGTGNRRLEVGRLLVQQVANDAALEELERVSVSGEIPAWSVDSLRHEYVARAAALTHALSEADAGDAAPPEGAAAVSPFEYTRRLRRKILTAERDALSESRHNDAIDHDALNEGIARIDAQLLAQSPDPPG